MPVRTQSVLTTRKFPSNYQNAAHVAHLAFRTIVVWLAEHTGKRKKLLLRKEFYICE